MDPRTDTAKLDRTRPKDAPGYELYGYPRLTDADWSAWLGLQEAGMSSEGITTVTWGGKPLWIEFLEREVR